MEEATRIIAKQNILKIGRLCIEKNCKEECFGSPDFNNISNCFGEILFESEFNAKCSSDLVVTIGGDGTIVWALKWLRNEVVPPVLTFDAAVHPTFPFFDETQLKWGAGNTGTLVQLQSEFDGGNNSAEIHKNKREENDSNAVIPPVASISKTKEKLLV